MNIFTLLIFAAIIPAYLCGSVNGAIIVSKLLYRKDIRDYGSGNAGLTNFYRVFGTGGVLIVILIDALKTILPVIFGGFIFNRFLRIELLPGILSENIVSARFLGQAISGFGVMLGHCFPLFYKFKGGKGVMAIGCIVFVLDWKIGLIAWGVFILLTLVFRYVSLGSIAGSITFPAGMMISDYRQIEAFGVAEVITVILCVLLLVIRHSKNINRILKGDESKISFKRKEKAGVK